MLLWPLTEEVENSKAEELAKRNDADDGYCWGDLEVIGEAGDALNAIMKTREESNGKMEEPTSLEQVQAAADLALKEFTDLVC